VDRARAGHRLRISCKETSTDRIEQQFATPRWVMEAGAQGGYYRMGQATGPEGPWEPEFDDPVFLAKLDRFLAAFAARYDAKPWLRYLDIGSIGDWGEGHCWAGSRKDLSFAVRKLHVDLHLKHFKRTQLVISDDYVHALNDPAERARLHQHILANGISYRDDSIMVDGYFAGTSDRFTVRSPEFFDGRLSPDTDRVRAGALRQGEVARKLGRSSQLLGGQVRQGQDRSGLLPRRARVAARDLHRLPRRRARVAGRQSGTDPGTAEQVRLLALPDGARTTGQTGGRCFRAIDPDDGEPRGGAALCALRAAGEALRRGTNWVHVAGRAAKSWLPGKPIVLRLELPLPAALQPGQYQLAIGLFDAAAGKSVRWSSRSKSRRAIPRAITVWARCPWAALLLLTN
jgi:hypothetical protein